VGVEIDIDDLVLPQEAHLFDELDRAVQGFVTLST
jgi:hypothetical protein